MHGVHVHTRMHTQHATLHPLLHASLLPLSAVERLYLPTELNLVYAWRVHVTGYVQDLQAGRTELQGCCRAVTCI